VAWPVQRLFKLPGKMLLGAPGTSPGFYTGKSGVNPNYGHVPLVADLDGDGRNDIVWVNVDGPARAYLNRSEGRFVAVRLPDAPRSIGARVRLEGARVPVHTHIAGQGLTSDRTAQVTIGLPKDDPAPTAVIVEWPDGAVTRIDNPRLNEPIMIPAR
jgi:hypothetical protein